MACPQRRSRWRESLYMLRELIAAVLPRCGLAHALENWSRIATGLADRPRKRKRRMIS